MYALLIALVFALAFLSLSNPFPIASPLEAPSPLLHEYEAYSDGQGRRFANYIGGVQRLISTYRSDVIDPAIVGDTPAYDEILAAMNAGGGVWTVSWTADPDITIQGMDEFIAASAFGGPAGLNLARGDFFEPFFDGQTAWRVSVIGQRDAAGVFIPPPDAEISAVIAWADPTLAPLDTIDLGHFMGGFLRTLDYSPNAGINQNGTLVSRGPLVSDIAVSAGPQVGGLPVALQPPPAGDQILIQNLPAFIPNGAPVFVQCRRSDERNAVGVAPAGPCN